MATHGTITFDNNPEKVYYAGQVLSGQVDLDLSQPQSVRGIYVEITGKAHCHWTTGTGDNKKSYSGNEVYLEERTYLVGSRDGDVTVQPGTYNYNFQCSLPSGLPTSLEATIGHIRYMVRVVMDIPMWVDTEFVEVFTVIKPLNLNYSEELRLPMMKEKHKVFIPCCCCCCCPSDPMHLVARVPVTGYTPGQTINIEIDVDNKSEETADFAVQLMKQITYYTYASSKRTKMETIKVAEEEHVGLSQMNSFEAFRVALVIPPIPPTDETTSNICKVRYLLRVHGTVYGCHNDAMVEFPITIGSFPILDSVLMLSPQSAGAVVDDGAGGYVFPVSYPPALPTLPITQQPVAAAAHHPLLPPNGANGVANGLPYPPLASTYPIPSAPSAEPETPAPAYPVDSKPFPEDDPPSYEQATEGNQVSGKNFQPSYPMFRRQTSYSSASNQ